MKKLLFAATLFAGTTLGFAKNQIQNRLLQNTISTSSETFSKEMKALHFTSFTEALAFMEECKDVVVAEQEVEVAKWSEASKKKIISKLKAYFIDSGYLIKDGNDYRLVKPIVPGDILENIKDNYKPVVLEALLQI